MNVEALHRRVALCRSAARIAGIAVISTGLWDLFRWSFGIHFLNSVEGKLAPIKANAAACMVLGGISLWVLRSGPVTGLKLRLVQLSAALIAGVGALSLAEHLGGWDFGIDKLLEWRSPASAATMLFGRMAPATALSLALLGAAFLFLDASRRVARVAAEYLTLAAAVIALSNFLGWLYGVEPLNRTSSLAPMTWQAASAFLAFCAGILLARPERGLVAVVINPTPGGVLARRILPAAILVPAILGWLRLRGQESGLYSDEVGTAMSSTALIIIFTAVAIYAARKLDRLDAERHMNAQAYWNAQQQEITRRMKWLNLLEPVPRTLVFRGYMAAIAGVAIAVIIRLLLDPTLGDAYAFSTFYPVVAFAVWYGGARPAALAIILGFLSAKWFFVAPRHTPFLEGARQWLELGTYLTGSLIIAFLGHRMRVAQRQTFRQNRRLEEEIAERKRAEEALAAAEGRLREHADELEARVQERTAKLAELVGDLEAFSYSITHDMRAPLRAIQGFAAIVAEECAAGISPLGKEYIRRIVTAASRMDHLIQDALNYARVARAELDLKPVALDTLIRGILESYPGFQRPAADIVLQGDVPDALGNEAALTQCISNLLDNAIKFVAPGVVPRVRLWAERRDGCVRLFVQDNGIGIDQESHERIFGIFQRLNKQYEGTGVGLAMVKKAAERMGGKVGLLSEPGKGTTFWLELKGISAKE